MPELTRAYAVALRREHHEQIVETIRSVGVKVVAKVEDYDDGDRAVTEAWITERTRTMRRIGRPGVSTTETLLPPEDTELTQLEVSQVLLAVAMFVRDPRCSPAVQELAWNEEKCTACNGKGGETDADEDGLVWLSCVECKGERVVMVPEEVFGAV